MERRIVIAMIGAMALMFAPEGPSLNGQSTDPLLPAHPAREYIRLGGRPVAVDSLPDVPNQAPQVIGVGPSHGTGGRQLFEFVYSDPNGFQDIEHTQITINQILTGEYSCYIYYAGDSVWLATDAYQWNWLGPVTLGTSATLENSQCRINALTSSASGLNQTLTLQLDLTFKPAFAGAKSIWSFVTDGVLDSGYMLIGSWSVP